MYPKPGFDLVGLDAMTDLPSCDIRPAETRQDRCARIET